MNLAFFGPFQPHEVLVVLLVVLFFFGAKKLPELAKGMGQAVREFSKAKDDIEREVTRPPTPETPRQLDEPSVTSHNEHAEPTPDTEPARPADSPETTRVS